MIWKNPKIEEEIDDIFKKYSDFLTESWVDEFKKMTDEIDADKEKNSEKSTL